MVIYPSIVIGLGSSGKKITEALESSILFRTDDFPAVDVILYPGNLVSGTPQEERKELSPETSPQDQGKNWRLEERNKFIKSIQEFSKLLDKSIREVMGFEAEKCIRNFFTEWPVKRQQSVNIYIVGALYEPVCSGVFLDIAYFCRHYLRKRHGMKSCSIEGVFILTPELSDNESAESGEKEKKASLIYASLKELDYHFESRNFSLDYLTPKPASMHDRPFDHCYLLDTVKKNRSALPKPENLTPIIGEILFHLIFPPMNEKMTNPLTNDVLSGYFLDQKITAYSAIGIASISFPRKDMLDGATNRYAGEIIRSGLLSPEPVASEVNEEEEDFEKRNGVTGEHFLESAESAQEKEIFDKVKDEILNSTGIEHIRFSPWYESDTLKILENKVEELNGKFKDQWEVSIGEERQEKIKKLEEKVTQRKLELLYSKRPDRQDKSVKFVIQFLKKLKDRIENRHTGIIEKKKNEHKDKVQELDRIQEVKRSRLTDWYETIPTKKQIYFGSAILILFSFLVSYIAFNLYPMKAPIAVTILIVFTIMLYFAVRNWLRNKIIQLRDEICETIKNWFIEKVSEFKYKKDIELIKGFVDALDRQIGQLEGFLDKLEQVESEFKSEEEKVLSKLPEQRSFITDESILSWDDLIRIYHDDKELGIPDLSNRNPRRIEDTETIDTWMDKTKEWLTLKFKTIAREKVGKSKLTKLKVEDLLKNKLPDSESLTGRFGEMLEDSSPLVSYGDMELPIDNIQCRTIFGYYSGSDPEIEEAFRQLPYEIDSVSTKRCDQFLSISISHGFPLCDINHLYFFKSEYEAIPVESKGNLHIFKDIENDEYDVGYIKDQREVEAERLCGIALCLGIILWKEDALKENMKVAILFKEPNEIRLEGVKPQGAILPLSLEPILSSEEVLKRLDEEIKKMIEELKPKDVAQMLQHGLKKYSLTRIMKKEIEYYLEKLGVNA